MHIPLSNFSETRMPGRGNHATFTFYGEICYAEYTNIISSRFIRMKPFQVDMFAEADVAAEAAEVSNTATLANAEHHAHLTDNWDDAEGYYRVQVCECITRSGPNRPAAAIGGLIFWHFLALWLVVLVFFGN